MDELIYVLTKEGQETAKEVIKNLLAGFTLEHIADLMEFEPEELKVLVYMFIENIGIEAPNEQ
jgi:hypothetical protein